MNRSLMGRQMFAKGGAAFPDYSGDGEITQKDILMGRGVIPRTMQEGGMVDPMMMQAPAPQGGEVDPDVLAGMFGEIEGQIQGLDQAEDIEGMMNAVRGDQQPVEARRAELAELVGPEDAQETPDSVLALVQPIMQLAAVDQGIGGLAADSMGDVAMEGPMAEGIMSTVNTAPPTDQAMMAPPMDPAMMGVGNQPPVNFRYGGAVQQMQVGGVVGADPVSPIQQAFDQRRDLYRSIIGDDTAQDQAMLDERRDLTKSQMLFDIANTALAFSTPGSRQMSPAQRLAEAARETQLLEKFGARTGAIQDLKDKQALASRSANRSLDMAALSASETDVSNTLAAKAALEKARLSRSNTIKTQSFLNKSGDPSSRISTVVGSEGYYEAMDDPNMVAAGAYSPETGLTQVYDPVTKKRKDVPNRQLEQYLADNPGSSRVSMASANEPKLSPVERIITDVATLKDYAERNLSDQDKITFEQAVLNYMEPKQTYDSATGTIVERRAELSQSVSDALLKGNPTLWKRITGKAVNPETGEAEDVNLMNADIQLMNEDGSVNFDSPIWNATEPVRFDESLDYEATIGISRLLPSLSAGVSEGASELGGGESSQEVKDFRDSQASLTGLANDLLQYNTGGQEGRVLKFVQELIELETKNIRPGGLLIKTDATAAASFANLKDGLTRGFITRASMIPAYNPASAGKFKEADVLTAKKDLQNIKVLLNDVIKFDEYFNKGGSTGGNMGTLANRKALFDMAAGSSQ